eukprot:565347-Rhodomonas_salina.1
MEHLRGDEGEFDAEDRAVVDHEPLDEREIHYKPDADAVEEDDGEPLFPCVGDRDARPILEHAALVAGEPSLEQLVPPEGAEDKGRREVEDARLVHILHRFEREAHARDRQLALLARFELPPELLFQQSDHLVHAR